MILKQSAILKLLFIIFFSFSSLKLFSQNNKENIQFVIDKMMPLIKIELEKNQLFFPIGATLNQQDSFKISMINERIDNEIIISNLEKQFKIENNKSNFKIVAIFYDAKATNPITKIKTDAVAVRVEHKNEKQAHIYYYPYKFISKNEIEILPAFGEIVDKRIIN